MRAADPARVPEVAVIVTVLPLLLDKPVATPAELTVAKLSLSELHVTLFVMSVELLSERMPVAVNA